MLLHCTQQLLIDVTSLLGFERRDRLKFGTVKAFFFVVRTLSLPWSEGRKLLVALSRPTREAASGGTSFSEKEGKGGKKVPCSCLLDLGLDLGIEFGDSPSLFVSPETSGFGGNS